jgi:hypothetical protein
MELLAGMVSEADIAIKSAKWRQANKMHDTRFSKKMLIMFIDGSNHSRSAYMQYLLTYGLVL